MIDTVFGTIASRLGVTVLGGLLATAGAMAAPPDPFPWGEIPAEHAAMDAYPDDPTAPGVVLGSLSDVEIRSNFSMNQAIRRRVKIFSEAAYDYASIEIVYRHSGRGQSLRGLAAQTFVPDGAGGLTRVELQREDIHEERDGDYTVVRFTLPALQPGAIFEYRYTVHSPSTLIIPDWTFQETLPVLWSEYRARFPDNITLNHHPVGDPEFSVAGIDAPPGASRRWRTTYRWVMEDIPAIRDEQFVASIWNHAYGIRFELARFNGRSISDSWDEIDSWLLGNTFVGDRIRSTSAIREKVAEVTAGAASARDRMDSLYDYVRRDLVWNERYRPFASRPLDDVLRSGEGSSGEINLLLIALLREAGLTADPVMISTRRHGEIVRWFASPRQFNHLIAQARIDGQAILLDATDRFRPAGMLSITSLNGHGRVLAEGRSRWVNLEPVASSMRIEIDGSINEDGRLAGILTGHFEGYPALFARHRFAELIEAQEEAEDTDAQGQAIVDSEELRFSEIRISGLDQDGPLSFETHFEAMEAGEAMGHLLTVEPVPVLRLSTNPFSDEERAYPVDFAFPIVQTFTGRFTLPAGFEYDELPPHVRLSTDGGGLTYARVISFAGGLLQVRRVYGRRESVFRPREYASLRDLYEEATAADAQRVVLIRSADEPGE